MSDETRETIKRQVGPTQTELETYQARYEEALKELTDHPTIANSIAFEKALQDLVQIEDLYHQAQKLLLQHELGKSF